MLECIITEAGGGLETFWQRLTDAAKSTTYNADRTVARNVVTDRRLGHHEFANDARRYGVVDDIVTFFKQWAARTISESGIDAGCKAVFTDAFKAVGKHGYSTAITRPEAACLRLAFLGFDTAKLTDQHHGEWVSFFYYTFPSENDANGGINGTSAEFLTDSTKLTDHIIKEFRSRPFRWFACRSTLQPLIDGAPTGGNGVQEFDAVRNLLGLDLPNDGRQLVAVRVPTLRQAPLGRVPTFFDSGGYEYFRPASADWYDQYHCGCTCPITIRDAKPAGVAELIAWVAPGPPALAHLGPANAALHGLAVLNSEAGWPRMFAVQSDPDLTDYHARRG